MTIKTLIIDDDPTTCDLLKAILPDNFGCSSIHSGQEALDLIQAKLSRDEHYDLIFLDIAMPEMDGHQTLVHLRKMEEQFDRPIGHGATIIMTTSLQDSQNIIKSFREGCEYYLTKPVEILRLMGILENAGLIEKNQVYGIS